MRLGTLATAFLLWSTASGFAEPAPVGDVVVNGYTPQIVMQNGHVLATSITVTQDQKGFVNIVNPSNGVSCWATFDDVSTIDEATAPVMCTGQEVGTLTIHGIGHGAGADGTLTLVDGSVGAFTLRPTSELQPMPPSSDQVSEVPASEYPSAPLGGCVSENVYGATSCITGLPRTRSVQGYTRSNGTYVHPYVRSR